MKRFLYLTVISFNAIGAMISISLFFLINPFYFQYLPLIFLCIAIFITSMTITIRDLNKKQHPKIIYIRSKRTNVIDYQDYFLKRKNEFIIA
jgi:hypothetical protein